MKQSLNNYRRIDNTYYLILFTGILQNESEIIYVKYLPHSVCLNHWFITKCTHNQVNESANKLCLFFFYWFVIQLSLNKPNIKANT